MQADAIKSRLDALYHSFDERYIFSDPLAVVREFDKPEDQEIVAVLASAMAFGQVQQILKALNRILDLMERSPRSFVETLDPSAEMQRWSKFYYRMVRSTDVLRLLFALKQVLLRVDTLGLWVASQYQESDLDLGAAWSRCVGDLIELDALHWKWRKSRGRGFRHLLPDPAKQSASKRAHLLLRWMVRKDTVDLGLWSELPKEKLLMPVDTHIGRLAYNIGLTDRTDASKRTAEEITSQLRLLDSVDPVKYDFALSRLGILDHCPRRKNPVKCAVCDIVAVCRL